jgi:hypothetical protein
MEEALPKLFEAGGTFALLTYIVWSVTGFLKSLIDHNTAMGDRLVQTNAELTAALKGFEDSRLEQIRVHQEQILLAKMTLDKLSEHISEQ